MSRDQLSSLLIAHLGTASDIVDFYSILAEADTIVDSNNLELIYVVLIFWTWSLLQVSLKTMLYNTLFSEMTDYSKS